jgi:hypothetical protein
MTSFLSSDMICKNCLRWSLLASKNVMICRVKQERYHLLENMATKPGHLCDE